LKATIEALKSEGITAVRKVAIALNARGIATPQGKQWRGILVHRLLRHRGNSS
jgi:hypothetical protein